jgi:hypothetical protein
MSISKTRRALRKEQAELRSRRCRFHGLALCEWRDCQKQVRRDFYGTRKKKIMHDTPTPVDIEALFRKLREPISYDERFSDDFPDEPTPAAPAPVPPASSPVSDPTWGLTLRERIKLAKVAA